MSAGVARGTECNKVRLGIVAGTTSKLFVVDFQVRHRAAGLPPAIAMDLLPEPFVGPRIQRKRGGSGRIGAPRQELGEHRHRVQQCCRISIPIWPLLEIPHKSLASGSRVIGRFPASTPGSRSPAQ
jgi:hypothetical protein